MKLLIFSSVTCGPCRMMAPIIKAVIKELNYTTEKFMAHEHQDKFRRHAVFAVPTFILLDENGKELRRKTGLIPKPDFKKFLGG